MEKYVVLEKQVGETPLSCAEAWRVAAGIDASVPLAYAGRLDPMASGKLLVLIGDECKNQTNYHGLDKAYDFSVLFGIGSDTHDVLGRLHCHKEFLQAASPSESALRAARPSHTLAEGDAALETSLRHISTDLTGNIELPYPHFSAKTVQGKPLHMWTLEGKLDEIDIPTKTSTIYSLELTELETKSRTDIAADALEKINTIPEVTDPRKALGNDFRRVDVRKDWAEIASGNFGPHPLPDSYQIAHFHCIATSGTYMRTLATVIAEKLGTTGLAWHIHRTNIGTYNPNINTWNQTY